MNIFALLGRSRELLSRMRNGDATVHSPGSFSLLALRLERDLATKGSGRGRSILVVATDDDALGVEATVELGWCLAEELGHSALLVDAAFDLPLLSTALGIAGKPGLAELLDAPARNQATLQAMVQPTMHERIAILPQGHDTGDGATRGEAIRELLAVASEQYDFVLVHGSVQVEGSRSMAFSSLVDAALLIAEEDKTTLDHIARGHRLLNDCGATRAALVLTNRPRANRSNGR